jgi:hypothetical protein
MVIFGEARLRRILWAYADYYNQTRTHLALNKDCPLERRFNALATSPQFPFWLGYIINMSGYDFRKGQPLWRRSQAVLRAFASVCVELDLMKTAEAQPQASWGGRDRADIFISQPQLFIVFALIPESGSSS